MIGAQLQKAIFDALTTAGICSGRIYDGVQENPVFPYVTIGDEQILEKGNSCQDGWEVFSDVHVWSRPATSSKAETKNIIAQIVPLLATTLTLTGFRTVIGELETSRVFRDPDGKTEHGVITLRFVIEPA